MATNNPITTSLPDYVEQNYGELLVKSVLGAKSAGLFELMAGLSGKTALNYMTSDPVFGDGSVCGWNEKGSTEFTQREIDPKYIAVNMAFCDKNFLNKYTAHLVKIAADPKTLPFEQEIMNEISNKIALGVEKLIWQGDHTSSAQTECDGILKILSDGGVTPIDVTAGGTAYEAVKKAYMALPAEVAQAGDAVIFVNDSTYRRYVNELVEKNFFNYATNETDWGNGETYVPGTNCRVIAVNGLNNTTNYDYVIAGQLSNFVYGCNLVNDKDVFDLFYSKDNREFRLVVEFLVGTQVKFLDQVVEVRIAK